MARFLQTGDFGDLGDLGYSEARAYPLNSELLHALMTMPFSRDVLVPLTAHLFAALALGAAFAIGHKRGAGAVAVLGVTVVLSLPLIGLSQPGQMYNDIIAASLLLCAVALLDELGLDAGGLAVAGAAIGLTISTKLSIVGVVAPLAIGVLVVAIAAKRYLAAASWVIALAVTGTFWFGRNMATPATCAILGGDRARACPPPPLMASS